MHFFQFTCTRIQQQAEGSSIHVELAKFVICLVGVYGDKNVWQMVDWLSVLSQA